MGQHLVPSVATQTNENAIASAGSLGPPFELGGPTAPDQRTRTAVRPRRCPGHRAGAWSKLGVPAPFVDGTTTDRWGSGRGPHRDGRRPAAAAFRSRSGGGRPHVSEAVERRRDEAGGQRVADGGVRMHHGSQRPAAALGGLPNVDQDDPAHRPSGESGVPVGQPGDGCGEVALFDVGQRGSATALARSSTSAACS